MKISPDNHTNWKNRTLFHGDNLRFLRAMNSKNVDLIATDPPFNKGRDFHATPESLAAGAKFQDRWRWEKDIHEKWVDQLKDDYPQLMEVIESARYAHSEGMGAYLCFMAVRLLEIRRILKSTGSIYLHCDPTASHYLKAAMDAIFGSENFKNDIIWHRARGKGLNPTKYLSNCDRILYYVCGKNSTWNQLYQPFDEDYGKDWKRDEFGPWQRADLAGGKAGGPSAYLPFKGVLPAPGRAWDPPVHTKFPPELQRRLPDHYEELNPLEKCEALDEAGLIYWPKKTGGKPRYKKYLSTLKGRYMSDLFGDILPIQAHANERTGYPTQKPLELYERLIKASSNEGDMICDRFAGCATTLVAAEKLNRQWVGIDIWENSRDVVLEQLAKQGLNQKGNASRSAHIFTEEILFTDQLPERTDDQEAAVPFLRVKERVKEPEGPRWSRAEMYAYLLDQYGYRCQGCDREFDDPRYLQLDHNTPRSDGGMNHITNRILLCGPCNQLKSNIYTLSGLRRQNRKRGYMAPGKDPLFP